MTNFTPEMIEKAKATKSAEELLELAEENGMELDEEQAKAYFLQLHPTTGVMSDDELENVSGGGCHTRDGRLVVTVWNACTDFGCKICGGTGAFYTGAFDQGYMKCAKCGNAEVDCNHCSFCSYENGLWLCNNPKNNK